MEIFPTIISSIQTVEERDLLYKGLGALESAQYRLDSSREEEIIKKEIPSAVAPALQKALRDSTYIQNPAKKRDFLRELKEKLKSLRILKIDLAFEPKSPTLGKISAWVKKNVGEDVVLDVGFDKTIVGGARITFGGKYLEETLEKILTREFEENRNIIVGLGLRK